MFVSYSVDDSANPIKRINDAFHDLGSTGPGFASNWKYQKRNDLEYPKITDEIVGNMLPESFKHEQKRMMSSDRMNHLFRDRRGRNFVRFSHPEKRLQKKGHFGLYMG